MNDDTKTWLSVGAGLCVLGFLYNKFKTQDAAIVAPGNSGSLTAQIGGLLTSFSQGNTGIAGKIAGGAGTVLSNMPTTSTATATNVAPSATVNNNTPVTTGTLMNVVGQFNNIIADIVTPASPANVVNSDLQTKFNEALKWARTATVKITTRGGTTIGPPKYVLLAKDGTIYSLDLTGKTIMQMPDTKANRDGQTGASGYLIF
jgi:hypothetical protein